VDESVEEMAKYAKGKKLPMPYLADKDQKVRDQFNATKNPEVFVLQNNGGGTFILKYRGAIDDNPQAPNVVTAFYLKDAIEAVLQKKNLALTERRAIGCMIKK
jgi:peroxiredoxin